MKYKKVLMAILAISMIWLCRGQLHRIGPEVGSGSTELVKIMYLIENYKDPNPVIRVNKDQKLVALTFDDGPDPRFTTRDLSILNQYHIHATFFVVGQSAREYPQLIRQEIADGNEVENHTYTHSNLRTIDKKQTEAEIKECSTAIRDITGQQTHYFRPPQGFVPGGYHKDCP